MASASRPSFCFTARSQQGVGFFCGSGWSVTIAFAESFNAMCGEDSEMIIRCAKWLMLRSWTVVAIGLVGHRCDEGGHGAVVVTHHHPTPTPTPGA